MAQKAAIKSRIKSINATKKITGAMELIASVKLQKQRNQMLKNRDYANVLSSTMNQILSGNVEVENDFLKEKTNPLKLVIVFCSDLGLCGGYNVNLTKLAKEVINPDDYVIVVGTKEYKWFKNNYNVINNEEILSDASNYLSIKKIVEQAITMFKENKIGSINVLYTHFVNNVTFKPMYEKVLPCEKEEVENKSYKEVILEPNPNDILNNLIPMFVENNVYSKYLESKTAEHGARRFAMENATDNAEELTDELLLAYNQARQAAITQEITEIIGGADAL